jgi:Asp-tRNA(Asn)/Glu-tRNA(Gln) amidotransferase A subunit family amidase
MALSWSMDKIGVIARSAEDCAIVFHSVHGPDGIDPTAVDRPFDWPPRRDFRSLRVGFAQDLFEKDRSENAEDEKEKARLKEWQELDQRTLQEVHDLGVNLIPISLPATHPIRPLSLMLGAEAAACFDQLTRTGRDDEMVRQVASAWPNEFRQAQLIPAVEYVRASRIRTLVMRAMQEIFADVDLYLCPSYGGDNLLLTNLTGHPCVVAPNGFRSSDRTPTSITFIGRLYGETEILSLAAAWQETTDYHRKRPPIG